MKKSTCLAAALFAALVLVSASVAQKQQWQPVTPEELQMKTPKVQPDADAEAIFWDVHVDDSSSDLALAHYVRVKIFTDRGRDMFSKRDIPFSKGTKIKDVDARVTKPDGTVVDLKDSDVMERDIVKAGGLKIKAKSFALPGLEVGSIVEYKYREVIDGAEADMRLYFQHDIPTETISYYVKPFAGDRAMAFQSFHMGETGFHKDKDGFYKATMENVRAYKEEPDSLPEDEVRSWMYIYYTLEVPKNPDEYWSRISKAFYEVSKGFFKANDSVKAAAAEATAGATSDDEKIHKIFDYVKTQIKNTTYADNVTDADKKLAASSKSPSDTLKNKVATSSDVDILFAAMAKAAGFDTRLALSGNRQELFFNPRIPNVRLMLSSSSVAVKVADKWRFFSPADYFAPYGMLSWVEEGQEALITDPKDVIWQKIPLADASRSIQKRTGKFRLLEDGTLEGEARIEFNGHDSYVKKMESHGDSQSERENELKSLIQSNMGAAEIESVSIENITDPEKPVVYGFKVRVPGYASKTGKRLFFQPNMFEKNSKPRFTASARATDICFNYPFSEHDEISIQLPAGYSLESADSPGDLGDSDHVTKDSISMGISNTGVLSYKRDYSIGNGGFIRFPAASYDLLKGLFEAFNKADVHQLTLKQDTK